MSSFYQSCNYFPTSIHFKAPKWQGPVLKMIGFWKNKKYERCGINSWVHFLHIRNIYFKHSFSFYKWIVHWLHKHRIEIVSSKPINPFTLTDNKKPSLPTLFMIHIPLEMLTILQKATPYLKVQYYGKNWSRGKQGSCINTELSSVFF